MANSRFTTSAALILHRISSYPAPPFPNWEDLENIKSDTLQFWRENGLVDAPPGWSTDFEGIDDDDEPWISMFLGRGSGSPDDFRSLERATHFYERPIPLLHTFYTPYHSEHVIVNVGGLLFLRNSDEPLVYAVNEGVSLEQLLAFAAQGQLPTREVTLEASQDIVG
ncbi:hypothetical protein QCA50_020348 [Cerrena zonata]|uniref:SMI1/KNR4 family protein n=1 Tax=Cerrena zonata TaxID=2478898 RepID=A0AAW0FH92_9APHY